MFKPSDVSLVLKNLYFDRVSFNNYKYIFWTGYPANKLLFVLPKFDLCSILREKNHILNFSKTLI